MLVFAIACAAVLVVVSVTLFSRGMMQYLHVLTEPPPSIWWRFALLVQSVVVLAALLALDDLDGPAIVLSVFVGLVFAPALGLVIQSTLKVARAALPAHRDESAPELRAGILSPDPPQAGGGAWTRKRVLLLVGLAVLLVLLSCSCAGLVVRRFIADNAASTAAMQVFKIQGYPGYRVVDSTRSGYILESEEHEILRIDVRFEKQGHLAAWDGPPREELSDGWSTAETFFSHAQGRPKDPRTDMTYDVDGFVEEYSRFRPGDNSVVCAVWLDAVDASGTETYVVWVARREEQGSGVESMWPDHEALFMRDSTTGEWSGSTFQPFEVANPN